MATRVAPAGHLTPAFQVLPRCDQQRLDVDVDEPPSSEPFASGPLLGLSEQWLHPDVARPERFLVGGRPLVATDASQILVRVRSG